MRKIFVLSVIFFLLALNVYGYVKDEYVPNEFIVKIRTPPTTMTVSSTNSQVSGLDIISALASKHKFTVNKVEKLTVMDKVIDKVDKKVDKRSRVKASKVDYGRYTRVKASFKEHGLDRIYLVRLRDGANVNEVIRSLGTDPNVEYAEPNYIVRPAIIPNDPFFSSLWGMHNTGQTFGTPDADIDAPEAWDIQTRSNQVIVAVIDTGVDYLHADLSANTWTNPNEVINNIDDDGNGYVDDVRGWDFFNVDNNPFDDHGHGTHVAGTIGAVGNNSKGVVGVNWNVKLMPLKVLGSGGFGSWDAIILAIQYSTLMGADITSNSYGCLSCFSQAVRDAIAAANDAGVLFVAAAGNDNNNNDVVPFHPANYDLPNVVSVAATDHNDLRAGFSNYGLSTVHLGAPGVDILSTAPNGSCTLCSPTGYIYLSGTSMATPHVSGVAALIKQKFNLTSDGTKARLLAGVDQIPSMNGITISGGRLNAAKGLENDTTPPAAVTDLAVINASLGSITLAWTATGDDGNSGTAGYYDVRYSTVPITDLNWGAANNASGEPNPKPAGSPETFKVEGLSYNRTYYFALKVSDNLQYSPLSNIASGATKVPIVIFEDRMENGINGWTSNGLWHQETFRSYSPTKSWAYNTGSPLYNYDTGNNQGNLTSPSVDLSNVKSAILEFRYLYQTETMGTFYDQRWVRMGANANFCGDSFFSNLAQLSDDQMLVWNNFSKDISQYAGKQNVQIRFNFDTIDFISNNFEGWYIDDVRIISEMPEIPTGIGISINDGNTTTSSEIVTLSLAATNADECRYINQNDFGGSNFFSPYEAFSATKQWNLSDGVGFHEGFRTVNYECRNSAGSSSNFDQITFTTTTVPTGVNISINDGNATTSSEIVTLSLTATGADECRYINQNDFGGSNFFSPYEAFTSTRQWNLSDGVGFHTGFRTVNYECKNSAGSSSIFDQIVLI